MIKYSLPSKESIIVVEDIYINQIGFIQKILLDSSVAHIDQNLLSNNIDAQSYHGRRKLASRLSHKDHLLPQWG